MSDIFFTEFALYVLECKTHERRVDLVGALRKLLPGHIHEVNDNLAVKIVKTAMWDKKAPVRELAWFMIHDLAKGRCDLKGIIQETLQSTAHNDAQAGPVKSEGASRNGVFPHPVLA